ncbi:MAG: diacylglycerol kinase family protein [Opitutaceae bacterium]
MRNLLSARLRSFRYAVSGLRTIAATQHNFRIHLIAASAVVVAGVWLHVSRTDWLWLVGAIAAVWLAEAFNTALEFLADAITSAQHPLIAKAKDCAAGAVLISVAGALAVGCLVLGPPLWAALTRS